MALLIFLGYAVGLVVSILLYIDAYKQGGILHLLLSIFIPLYALYWAIFKAEKKAQILGGWALSILLIFAGAAMMGRPPSP